MDPHLTKQIFLYQGTPSPTWRLISDVLKVIISTVSVVVCLHAIRIFIKFKDLRKDSNTYFFHYFICSTIKLLLGPILYFFHLWGFASAVLICVIKKIAFGPTIVEVSFAGVLAIDWVLVNYKSKFAKKYEKLQNCLLISCYINAVISAALSIAECLTDQYFYSSRLNVNNFFITLGIVIAVNVFVNCKKIGDRAGSKHPLIIATCMLVLWLPNMLYEYYAHVRDVFVETQNGYGQFVGVSVPLTQILSYFVPVFVFWMLLRKNETFGAACKGAWLQPEKRETLAMTDGPNDAPGRPISIVSGNEPAVFV